MGIGFCSKLEIEASSRKTQFSLEHVDFVVSFWGQKTQIRSEIVLSPFFFNFSFISYGLAVKC